MDENIQILIGGFVKKAASLETCFVYGFSCFVVVCCFYGLVVGDQLSCCCLLLLMSCCLGSVDLLLFVASHQLLLCGLVGAHCSAFFFVWPFK